MRFLSFLITFLFLSCSNAEPSKVKEEIPSFLLGNFEDDYQVNYSISDSLFTMEEHTILHISEWNLEGQYFIGQNDSLNPYDPLLFTRIDWMRFEGMEPFMWGFCMSAYNSTSIDSARAVSTADRKQPKTGCGSYPFSRMKRIQG